MTSADQRALKLDLSQSAADLTIAICDIDSVSGNETRLADAVHEALAGLPHLEVTRHGDTVVARTRLGRDTRVAIAGHLDTVPINANWPTQTELFEAPAVSASGVEIAPGRYIWGRGTVDMKAGVAVQLKLAAELTEPRYDITWMFYDHEEVDAELNGLNRLAAVHPELFEADFAVLGEPTAGEIEGGCNGNLRFFVRQGGRRAHSARAWVGENAIHKLAPVLDTLASYEPRTVAVEGLEYREGLNAVGIEGGVASNVIPDAAAVHVNYRFAPDKSVAEALAHMREVFAGYELEVVDAAEGARPGLDAPAAQAFVASVGGVAKPKYGWTDVARFSAMGVPAVNYGPGDPLFAHADDERVPVHDIERVETGMRAWLAGA